MPDHNSRFSLSLRNISLDVWAVTAAFLLAFLVRVGVLKHIPW